jgi:hypothetical protein
MRCRVVVCAACCTRINGVNHCHACLKVLGRGIESKRTGSWWALSAALLFGLAWLLLFGLCWAIGGKMAP